MNSMSTLLNRRAFGQITVNDLCEEAFISRATFYTHFNDKYDLLKYWMTTIRKDIITDVYAETEAAVNQFISENNKLITNLMEDANAEVLELLHDFMYSIIDIAIIKKSNGIASPDQIVLSNFCAGGMANLFMWQIKNKFPPDAQMITPYFHKIMQCLTQLDSRQ